MRETLLKRASILVAVLLLACAAGLGIVRNTLTAPQGHQSGLSKQAAKGGDLFRDKGCSGCHHTASTRSKVGPGLKGLFDREQLPASGRPVTEENIRRQLIDPYENMPSFADRLTRGERTRIISYLETL